MPPAPALVRRTKPPSAGALGKGLCGVRGGGGGDAAAFLLLLRNVVGKTSGKLLEHPNPLRWMSLDIPAPKEGAAPSLVPANHLA